MRLAVGRAVIGFVNDALKLQGVQITLLEDEVRDNVERFQQYGLTSVPHRGAEAIVVSVGGNRNHAIVIAVDDRRYRLKGLQAGEVALYTDEGDYIKLARDRVVEVQTDTLLVTAATKVRFDTPLVETTGRIEADGSIRDLRATNNRTIDGMRAQYNDHTHPDPQGGNTSPPSAEM